MDYWGDIEEKEIQEECRRYYEEEYELPRYHWNNAPEAYRYFKNGLRMVVPHPGELEEGCHNPGVCLFTGGHQCLEDVEAWTDNLGATEVHTLKAAGLVLARVFAWEDKYLFYDEPHGTVTEFDNLADLRDFTVRALKAAA